MSTFTAYFDETGHIEDPNIGYCGVAGFVARACEWEIFEERWRDTLSNAGLREPFHMKDFAHSKKQFESWKNKKDKRKLLYGRLMEIIVETRATPVGAIVSIDDYRGLTAKQQLALCGPKRNPYYFCFQTCVGGAALDAAPPEKNVDIVFAYNTEFTAHAERLWTALTSVRKYSHTLGSYTVSRPDSVVQLQAADIMAYEMFREFDARRKDPSFQMRWGMRQLLRMAQIPLPRIRLFDRKELLRVIKEMGCIDQTGVSELSDNQAESAMEQMMRLVVERSGIYP